MFEKYETLNIDAKKYIIKELENKCKDKQLLNRCYKEINILYDTGLLFIISYLYKFKKNNKKVSYIFYGTINNLLLLYVLDLSKVNPITYNLPYELFTDTTIKVDLINTCSLELIWFLEKYSLNFKIISGSFEKDEIDAINELEENHYLLLPNDYLPSDMLLKFNEFGILQTIDDYRNYKKDYLTIKIGEKSLTHFKNVNISNVLNNDFEIKLAEILKPKTINDYVKIKSIAHGTNVWKNNQEMLFSTGKLNINNLIATREDIFEHLLNHQVDKNVTLEIINFIRKRYNTNISNTWKKYVAIMKKHNCDDMFIEIISKILFISSRGQAVQVKDMKILLKMYFTHILQGLKHLFI